MLPVHVTKFFELPGSSRWGFDLLGDLDWFSSRADRAADVRVDVREDADHYYIDADVPGFNTDNIDVTLEDGILTISGERQAEQLREGQNYHVTERSVGRFARSIRIGEDVNADSVEATLKDGVLTVKLAKAEEAKARRIEIKAS